MEVPSQNLELPRFIPRSWNFQDGTWNFQDWNLELPRVELGTSKTGTWNKFYLKKNQSQRNILEKLRTHSIKCTGTREYIPFNTVTGTVHCNYFCQSGTSFG